MLSTSRQDRAVIGSVLLPLLFPVFLAAQQPNLSREYIYSGDRLVSVEIPAAPPSGGGGIVVTPNPAQVNEGDQITFTANEPVTWDSPTIGQISAEGVYTAPAPGTISDNTAIVITARSTTNTQVTGIADLTILKVATGGGGGQPELTVFGVTGPSSVTVGDSISVSYTAQNSGANAGAFRIGFYLSTDTTITTSDTLLGTVDLPSLATGSQGGSTSLSTAGVPTAAYNLGAIVDDLSQVAEDDETNNSTSGFTISVQSPPPANPADLVIDDISLNPPSVEIFSALSFAVDTRNVGGEATGPFSMKVMLSPTSDPADAINEQTCVETIGIAANSTKTLGCILAPDSTGQFFAIVQLDSLDEVVESNEGDNQDARSVTVIDQSFFHDLYWEGQTVQLTISPLLVEPGEALSFSGGYTNLAEPFTPQNSFFYNFPIGAYISTEDDLIEVSDVKLWDPNCMAPGVPWAFHPKIENTCPIPATIPALTPPGPSEAGVFLDSGFFVPETNEQNNVAQDTIQVLAEPTVLSVNPTSGSGLSATFTVVASDANGASDIEFVEFLFNTMALAADGCYVAFNASNASIELYNDSGTAVAGSVTPGGGGTASNSQCTIHGSGSSVTPTGNQLSVSVSVTFASVFDGKKEIFVSVRDFAGLPSTQQWADMGNWIVGTAVPPTADSLSPTNGSGPTTTFTISGSDGNGSDDITWATLIVGDNSLEAANCWVSYEPHSDVLYLLDDAGLPSAPVQRGSAVGLQNAQCSIDTFNVSFTSAGNSLSVSIPVTFAGTYRQQKNVYVAYSDNVSSTGPVLLGDYDASAPSSNYTTRALELFYKFDEGSGQTVLDHSPGGAHAGTLAGGAQRTTLGVTSGYVTTSVADFAGNRLDAAAGDDFTVIWVGRFAEAPNPNYQRLWAMQDTSGQPTMASWDHLTSATGDEVSYLIHNNGNYNWDYVTSLNDKVVMAVVRCLDTVCQYRFEGVESSWKNVAIGTTTSTTTELRIGATVPNAYRPMQNMVASLFWVYTDQLSDQEITDNFNYAGGVIGARNEQLEGYAGPVNQLPSVTMNAPPGNPFAAPASITLTASASDPDGFVDRVEFWADGTLIGTDSTGSGGQYSHNWNSVQTGTYVVEARVFDDQQAVVASTPAITITVVPPAPPSNYTTRALELFYKFDEGSGQTVLDHSPGGAHAGTLAGGAQRTTLGVTSGYVTTSVADFAGNRLDAAAGDDFTVIWVGRFAEAPNPNYQRLWAMQDTSGQPTMASWDHLTSATGDEVSYLIHNNGNYNWDYVTSLNDKVVMAVVRCLDTVCQYRFEGVESSWKNVAIGTTTSTTTELRIGATVPNAYRPMQNMVASLFWVYTDQLSDQEITDNFNYAGGVIGARNEQLEGYTPAPNQPPTVSFAEPPGNPFTAPASIVLTATANDPDGTVDLVEFWADGTMIGAATSATSTFQTTWNVIEGTYSVTAKAYDNGGAFAVSTPAVTITVNGPPSVPFPNNYAYRRAIAIQGSKVSGGTDLVDFPVLVSETWPELRTVANGGHVEQANGQDIRFELDGGVKLDHEIESWNASTGEIVAWVRVPSLSATSDTTIYLYYGNASAPNEENATAVWDSNYRGVWHLSDGDSTSAGYYKDSTSYGHHGTLVDTDGDTVSASGQIGSALDLSGDADYLNLGSASTLDNIDSWTVSAWITRENTSGDSPLFFKGPWKIELRGASSSNPLAIRFRDFYVNTHKIAASTTQLQSTTEKYFVTLVNGSSAVIPPFMYINGSEDTVIAISSPTGQGVSDAADDLTIGFADTSPTEFFEGVVDEVRISTGGRSSDWIATEYNNQMSPATFIIAGPEEAGP